MATLNDQISIILGWLQARHPDGSFGEQCAKELEQMIRQSLGGERVYIPAPDTSKRDAIERAVRTLPTAVVVERFGVTRQYVNQLRVRGISKKRN